jgi:hypothetical protein
MGRCVRRARRSGADACASPSPHTGARGRLHKIISQPPSKNTPGYSKWTKGGDHGSLLAERLGEHQKTRAPTCAEHCGENDDARSEQTICRPRGSGHTFRQVPMKSALARPSVRKDGLGFPSSPGKAELSAHILKLNEPFIDQVVKFVEVRRSHEPITNYLSPLPLGG